MYNFKCGLHFIKIFSCAGMSLLHQAQLMATDAGHYFVCPICEKYINIWQVSCASWDMYLASAAPPLNHRQMQRLTHLTRGSIRGLWKLRETRKGHWWNWFPSGGWWSAIREFGFSSSCEWNRQWSHSRAGRF